jgi:hypothetical protein
MILRRELNFAIINSLGEPNSKHRCTLNIDPCPVDLCPNDLYSAPLTKSMIGQMMKISRNIVSVFQYFNEY